MPITAKGYFDDLDKIMQEEITDVEKIKKMLEKVGKLILTVRSNTVAIMKFLKIPLQTKEEEKE